jgi:hypothetical protein
MPALAQQFTEAAATARNSAGLDHIASLLWKAHGEGAIADAEAEAVAEALQARRAAFARPAAGVAVAQAATAAARRRPAPRSPDRQASLERRRRCAMSGAVPAKLAAAFTLGELAVLSVIAGQVRKHGACTLPVDAIAALAGTSRSTVGNAIRLAIRLGLIDRRERRRAGQRSETNILRIISREWTAWLRLGGGVVGLKNLTATNNRFSPKGKSGEKAQRGRVQHWHRQACSANVLNE